MDNCFFIEETESTNVLLRSMIRKDKPAEGFVVYTGYQTAGKGQTGNQWEAEAGKNLLFSMVFYPDKLPLDQLFFLSQVVSVGIKRVLDELTEGISIKWPNDMYYRDKKLAGILIENSLQGNKVTTVAGIGLNVNQEVFRSNAPNPVSLCSVIGKQLPLHDLLESIVHSIMDIYTNHNPESVRTSYAQALYRREGYHSYSTESEMFEACIDEVKPDGQLILETTQGTKRGFYFKEVKYC